MIYRYLKIAVAQAILWVARLTDRWRAQSLPVLLYHAVDPVTSPVSLHPADFSRHLAYLRGRRFVFLSLAQAAERARLGRGFPPRSVAITFDDGYKNNLHPIRDILAAGGVPTVFLATGHIGTANRWDANTPSARPMATLDAGQISALHREGCDFGGHSASHVRLTGLPVSEVEREASTCRDHLEKLLGAPPFAFAYPYGAFSPAVSRAVSRAGFAAAFTTKKAYWHPDGPVFEIPRFAIDHTVDFLTFRLIVHRAYHWYQALSRVFSKFYVRP